MLFWFVILVQQHPKFRMALIMMWFSLDDKQHELWINGWHAFLFTLAMQAPSCLRWKIIIPHCLVKFVRVSFHSPGTAHKGFMAKNLEVVNIWLYLCFQNFTVISLDPNSGILEPNDLNYKTGLCLLGMHINGTCDAWLYWFFYEQLDNPMCLYVLWCISCSEFFKYL